MGDGTLIGLLHVTPKTHLRVSEQTILGLLWAQESFIRRYNSNSASDPSTKLLPFRASQLHFTVKIGPIICYLIKYNSVSLETKLELEGNTFAFGFQLTSH
jgi:hypothetical protein